MKIWTADYYLRPKEPLNAKTPSSVRFGFLIKVEFEKGLVGFADCFPWPEFGHEDVKSQKALLKEGKLTRSTERSLALAKKEALARQKEQSLFSKSQSIKNHFLIPNILNFQVKQTSALIDLGYSHLKIKMGRDLKAETLALKALVEDYVGPLKLRLDFNNSSSFEELKNWLNETIGWLKSSLDFIEDPFYYEKNSWVELAERFQVPLALDWAGDPREAQEGIQVFVLKPALQDIFKITQDIKSPTAQIVITHLMDHPLGQMAAFSEALQLVSQGEERVGICGLQNKDIYETISYSKWIETDGPFLKPPIGFGFGFDALLDRENWKEL